MASSFSTTEARNNLGDILSRVNYGKETIKITRRGKCVAVVVPVEEYEYWKEVEEQEDAEDVRQAGIALEEYKRTGKTIPWEKIKKKHNL